MKYEQHSVGLGEDATEMQRNVYQMLLGLGCHSFSACLLYTSRCV